MRRHDFLLLGAVLGVATLASAAHARPSYPDYIPAAPVDGRCGTCHVDPMGGGARNAFGEDVEASIADDGPDWSALFCLDSDGDGRTNGEELGDPCGEWSPGSAPMRTEPVSAPGDPGDVIEGSDEGVCAGEDPPSCPSAASAAGCAQAGSGALGMSLALLAVASERRRRR